MQNMNCVRYFSGVWINLISVSNILSDWGYFCTLMEEQFKHIKNTKQNYES